MEEKKGIKISLGTAICMCIIIILIFALAIVYYFGFIYKKDTDEKTDSNTNVNISNENVNNTNTSDGNNTAIKLEPSTYVIKFNANLLGEKYETSGNEIKEGYYGIMFSDNNTVTVYLGWGIYMKGTYTISDDRINCMLTSCGSEFPPEEKINEKISFKINNESEIEITDIPETYTIHISELGESGWVLSDETKEMEFWPFVKGIKFGLDK